MTKKTKKRIVIGAVMLGVVGLGAFNVMNAMNQKPTLQTTSVVNSEIKSVIALSGIVKQGDTDEYISTGSTIVKNVNYKVGDEVKKGDVIITFDNTDAIDNYKQTMIRYEQQRLALAEKERKYFETIEDIDEEKEHLEFHKKKMKEYENFEGTSTEEGGVFKTYQAKYDQTKIRIENLEKSIPSDEAIKIDQLDFELTKMNLDSAEKTVAELPKDIVAQSDGIIESLTARKLGAATKGQLLATVKTIATDVVEVKVGKYDVSKVAVGQPAAIKCAGKDYSGTIVEMSSMATTDSNVIAKIKVDNADEKLIPSMNVDADITTYSNSSVMAIPIETVKTDKDGDYCYTIELIDEEKQLYKANKTYITIGNSSDALIEVLGGLEENQKVIKNPPKTIDGIIAFNISEPV